MERSRHITGHDLNKSALGTSVCLGPHASVSHPHLGEMILEAERGGGEEEVVGMSWRVSLSEYMYCFKRREYSPHANAIWGLEMWRRGGGGRR